MHESAHFFLFGGKLRRSLSLRVYVCMCIVKKESYSTSFFPFFFFFFLLDSCLRKEQSSLQNKTTTTSTCSRLLVLKKKKETVQQCPFFPSFWYLLNFTQDQRTVT